MPGGSTVVPARGTRPGQQTLGPLSIHDLRHSATTFDVREVTEQVRRLRKTSPPEDVPRWN
jgi:pantothenate kinase